MQLIKLDSNCIAKNLFCLYNFYLYLLVFDDKIKAKEEKWIAKGASCSHWSKQRLILSTIAMNKCHPFIYLWTCSQTPPPTKKLLLIPISKVLCHCTIRFMRHCMLLLETQMNKLLPIHIWKMSFRCNQIRWCYFTFHFSHSLHCYFFPYSHL